MDVIQQIREINKKSIQKDLERKKRKNAKFTKGELSDMLDDANKRIKSLISVAEDIQHKWVATMKELEELKKKDIIETLAEELKKDIDK